MPKKMSRLFKKVHGVKLAIGIPTVVYVRLRILHDLVIEKIEYIYVENGFKRPNLE